MRLRFGLLILATGFVTVQAGTFTVVAPNGNSSVNGSANQYGIFDDNWTFQWELAASQLTPLAGDSLTAIGFRLDSGESSLTPTTVASFDLQLSSAVNPIGSMSSTFGNNIGPDAVTVYDASLSLGSLTGGSGPNPFFLITFSTPYTYTGGNLVMTATVSGASSTSFSVDANRVGDGYGDTVFSNMAEYFNYPITELQATTDTTTPEPATLLSLAGGLLALGALRLHKSRHS